MKREANLITTVFDLVRAFGGTAELAEFLDVGPSCVSNWKRENFIPPGWHLRLYLEAQRRNLRLSESVFGEAPPLPVKSRRTRNTQKKVRKSASVATA